MVEATSSFRHYTTAFTGGEDVDVHHCLHNFMSHRSSSYSMSTPSSNIYICAMRIVRFHSEACKIEHNATASLRTEAIPCKTVAEVEKNSFFIALLPFCRQVKQETTEAGEAMMAHS